VCDMRATVATARGVGLHAATVSVPGRTDPGCGQAWPGCCGRVRAAGGRQS